MNTIPPLPTPPQTPSAGAASLSGACRLPQWGVIRASGADAASFLHGQLSNDFSRLGVGPARLAAYCNAQGRMLASFIGVKRSAEELWLAGQADLLAQALRRLSMFVLRAKAKLSDAGDTLAVLGLAGPAAVAWVQAQATASGATPADAPWDGHALGDAHLVRLHDGAGQPRWLWIGPPAAAEAVLAALPALRLDDWQWLDVKSGVAPVQAATTEKFVPQMLNYELVGGVDFKKGCYPGQEVVARSQYLGKLKRRAFLVEADAPMQPGQELYWSGDTNQPAGLVAAAAPSPDGHWAALAELKLAVVHEGSLHLGSPGGAAVRLGVQPIALPEPADGATRAG